MIIIINSIIITTIITVIIDINHLFRKFLKTRYCFLCLKNNFNYSLKRTKRTTAILCHKLSHRLSADLTLSLYYYLWLAQSFHRHLKEIFKLRSSCISLSLQLIN